MGCAYFPFFDVSQLTLGTLRITRTTFDSIPPLAALPLNEVTADDLDSAASSIFQLSTFTNIAGTDLDFTPKYRHFASAGYFARLTVLLRQYMVFSDWGAHHNFNITLDPATWKVTISADVNFGVTWSSAAGRALFGFAANITQTASSYTGTYTPNKMIDCTLDAPSPGGNPPYYEADDLGSHVITDSGTGSTLSRSTAPLYADWDQEFETRVKTFQFLDDRLLAHPEHPYSFEQMFRDCRLGMPFIIRGTGLSPYVYSLRTDGMSFTPRPAAMGWDVCHVPFKCIFEGQAV